MPTADTISDKTVDGTAMQVKWSGNFKWKLCSLAVFYRVLGIKVRWHGEQNLPKERHVIVSNHVSVRVT